MNQGLKKVHFIAIGGSVMSNLAVALHRNGVQVSGSDDKIYDPARTLLDNHGLLPEAEGWFEEKVGGDLDAVILGMHAKEDNPELLAAQKKGIKVYSFPEFIAEASKDKQRIVICGSHGKTTITAMIVHVLSRLGRSFDFLVGAKINGIDDTIRLSNAPVIIVEGDEYLSSPLDRTPKFLKYNHHIALINGIAWDHVNVYPTLDSYVEQFEVLADRTPKAGSLVFYDQDHMTSVICNKERDDVKILPYADHPYIVKDGRFYMKTEEGEIPVQVFGKHNMQNIAGAMTVLGRIGVTKKDFYHAIQDFEGSFRRNTLVTSNDSIAVYEDFAHSPSKLEATVTGLKELYPSRKLTTCYELHTFSSLNKDFLKQYKNKLSQSDNPIIYLNHDHLIGKGYPEITDEEIKAGFDREDITVFREVSDLSVHLTNKSWENENLIFMSSGNFDGLNIKELAQNIIVG